LRSFWRSWEEAICDWMRRRLGRRAERGGHWWRRWLLGGRVAWRLQTLGAGRARQMLRSGLWRQHSGKHIIQNLYWMPIEAERVIITMGHSFL
jgi:hypothetical protein